MKEGNIKKVEKMMVKNPVENGTLTVYFSLGPRSLLSYILCCLNWIDVPCFLEKKNMELALKGLLYSL